MDYHIKKLENEKLVVRKPSFISKRVLNSLEITDIGRIRIESDIKLLKDFLENFNLKIGDEIGK